MNTTMFPLRVLFHWWCWVRGSRSRAFIWRSNTTDPTQPNPQDEFNNIHTIKATECTLTLPSHSPFVQNHILSLSHITTIVTFDSVFVTSMLTSTPAATHHQAIPFQSSPPPSPPLLFTTVSFAVTTCSRLMISGNLPSDLEMASRHNEKVSVKLEIKGPLEEEHDSVNKCCKRSSNLQEQRSTWLLFLYDEI